MTHGAGGAIDWKVDALNDGRRPCRMFREGGVYFCPGYMVGSGRAFEEDGFMEKLREIDGYVVSDITVFP